MSRSVAASLTPDRPIALVEEIVVASGRFLDPTEEIVVASGGLFMLVDEFACYSAACRPPRSGGTGGSLPRAGSGSGFRPTPRGDLEAMFPGLNSPGNKKVYADGTMSVEGLREDGSFISYRDSVEQKAQENWDSIGVPKDQYVGNLVAAGKIAMGIDLVSGEVNEVQAAKGRADSKWYTQAHEDTLRIAQEQGYDHIVVAAATTVLSAGRLWSGTKNGNVETVRALAQLIKNPIELDIQQQHLDLIAYRLSRSAKSTGRVGLSTPLQVGKISTRDLDSATLAEVLYVMNTLRGHTSFEDWAVKSTKDGVVGMKSTREQQDTPSPFPYFTSKGTLQVKQALAVLRGEVTPRQAISGPKFSSFVSNIMNPNRDYSSTNDTWHYRIMAGRLPLKFVRKGTEYSRTIVEHSLKDHNPDGVIVTPQDIFQRSVASKPDALAPGDVMFRDTTRITRDALDTLKREHPEQFGDMKLHEFQALIWVHYGGGLSSDDTRTDRWFGALDEMGRAGI